MATRNYRQAKRSREESRKKRQQEKLQRKQTRGSPAEPLQDASPAEAVPATDPDVSP